MNSHWALQVRLALTIWAALLLVVHVRIPMTQLVDWQLTSPLAADAVAPAPSSAPSACPLSASSCSSPDTARATVFLLCGHIAAGKSTLAQRLVLHHVQQHDVREDEQPPSQVSSYDGIRSHDSLLRTLYPSHHSPLTVFSADERVRRTHGADFPVTRFFEVGDAIKEQIWADALPLLAAGRSGAYQRADDFNHSRQQWRFIATSHSLFSRSTTNIGS